MDTAQLIERAAEARLAAYAKYSGFRVGAAVLADDGRIFTGCNIENISYGLTICAERVAIFSAVAAGAHSFIRIAVVADTKELISPCGACRQVMAEFNPTLAVISADCQGHSVEQNLEFLLPKPTMGILNGST
jgi:cytidine deaminase